MNELLLVARIAGQRVAMPAASVQSLIEIEHLTPVPRAPAHIAGLAAVRSRLMTVIDCARSLKLDQESSAPKKREAVLVEHEGHPYALLVDGVEDVTLAQSQTMPMQADVGRGWGRVSLGRIETEKGQLHLIDIGQLIVGPVE